MPITYCINDQNWTTVLSELADQHYKENNHLMDYRDNLAWILKPALLNNGQHIKIFHRLSQIEAHYLSSKRFRR